MTRADRTPSIAAALVALVLFFAPGASRATPIPEPHWAAIDVATIRPGVQTVTAGQQCTANFVFYDGRHVYVGQAAHCAGTDGNAATDGCEAGTLPVGTRVDIEGAARAATIVYSSWATMQQRGEVDDAMCRYNDFALVRLSKADARRVNPTIPFWGGPSGLADGSSLGDAVYGYGNSGLWLGVASLQPHQGVSLGADASGRSHKVYTAPPGIPGDSGSAYLDAEGKALGVLSTIELVPMAASNDLTDLRRALRYMRAHTGFTQVRLARGTEPFAA